VFRGRVSQLTNRNGHSKFVRGMELPTAGKLVLVYLWAVTMAREHHIGLTQALDESLIISDKTSVHIPMAVFPYYVSRGWDDPMYIKGVESNGSVCYHQNRDSYRKYLPGRR